MTGTIVAQALPIAISPILARMYSPEDFGVLALFMAFATVFGSIANARYEMAIVIPKSEKEALSIFLLGLIVSGGLSLFLFIIVLIFHGPILSLFDNKEISIWLYFVPLSVLGIGIYNSLNFYNTRVSNFKNIAKSNVVKSTILVLLNLVIGFFKNGPIGLVVGQIVSYFSGNLKLYKAVSNNNNIVKEITLKDIKEIAIKYKDFPKFTMPSTLANVLSQNLTSVVTSILFNIKTLGLYSFALRVMGSPSLLIGKAFSQVYINEASKQRREYGNATQVFNNTLKKLLLISVPIFFVVFFIAEDAFAIIFGEEWRVAGLYAKILIPLFWARFITAPISVTNSVFEKQKISLYWQLGLLTLTILIFLLAFLYKVDFQTFLYYYSGILSTYYIFFIFILKKVSSGSLSN